MNEIDRRLRSRLERLEAAVPAPAPPVVIRLPARRSWRRPLRFGFLVAALVVGSVAATIATSAPPPMTPAEEAARHAEEMAFFDAYDAMDHPPCPTVAQAKATARAIFAKLGLDDWTIRDDGRYRDAPCVGMAAIGDVQEVLLMPGMGRTVAEGLDALRDEMLKVCMGRQESIDVVTELLHEAGLVEPDVQVGGALIVPIDGADRFVSHVADGCHVYSNAQFDEHGRYTWYVAGP